MYHRILLPTDGAEASQRAVAAAVALAGDLGAEVVGLAVTPAFHVVTTDAAMLECTPEQFQANGRVAARVRLADVDSAARAAGVRCRLVHRVDDHPDATIVACALEQGCDLIAMASRGRGGLSAILLGSTTRGVLAESDVPVLVYR